MAEFRGDFGVKCGRFDKPACVRVAGVEPEGNDEVNVGVGSHSLVCGHGLRRMTAPKLREKYSTNNGKRCTNMVRELSIENAFAVRIFSRVTFYLAPNWFLRDKRPFSELLIP